MAKSKTAAKRARKAEENRLRNKAYKSRLKTAIKKYESALQEENQENAKNNLLEVTSLIDKSVNKGVLHKNTAARRKSSLVKRLNSVGQ